MSATQVPLVSYLRLGDAPALWAHQCQACGARFFDRRVACGNCGQQEFADAKVANRGTVVSFTIVHRAAPGIPAPYASAIITTEDGTSVRSNIVNCDPTPERITLGMEVELTTYSIGTDDEGTEAVAFGYQPVEEASS